MEYAEWPHLSETCLAWLPLWEQPLEPHRLGVGI